MRNYTVHENETKQNDEINLHEPVHDKTNNLGFRPGPTQTDLYSYRSRLET